MSTIVKKIQVYKPIMYGSISFWLGNNNDKSE